MLEPKAAIFQLEDGINWLPDRYVLLSPDTVMETMAKRLFQDVIEPKFLEGIFPLFAGEAEFFILQPLRDTAITISRNGGSSGLFSDNCLSVARRYAYLAKMFSLSKFKLVSDAIGAAALSQHPVLAAINVSEIDSDRDSLISAFAKSLSLRDSEIRDYTSTLPGYRVTPIPVNGPYDPTQFINQLLTITGQSTGMPLAYGQYQVALTQLLMIKNAIETLIWPSKRLGGVPEFEPQYAEAIAMMISLTQYLDIVATEEDYRMAFPPTSAGASPLQMNMAYQNVCEKMSARYAAYGSLSTTVTVELATTMIENANDYMKAFYTVFPPEWDYAVKRFQSARQTIRDISIPAVVQLVTDTLKGFEDLAKAKPLPPYMAPAILTDHLTLPQAVEVPTGALLVQDRWWKISSVNRGTTDPIILRMHHASSLLVLLADTNSVRVTQYLKAVNADEINQALSIPSGALKTLSVGMRDEEKYLNPLAYNPYPRATPIIAYDDALNPNHVLTPHLNKTIYLDLFHAQLLSKGEKDRWKWGRAANLPIDIYLPEAFRRLPIPWNYTSEASAARVRNNWHDLLAYWTKNPTHDRITVNPVLGWMRLLETYQIPRSLMVDALTAICTVWTKTNDKWMVMPPIAPTVFGIPTQTFLLQQNTTWMSDPKSIPTPVVGQLSVAKGGKVIVGLTPSGKQYAFVLHKAVPKPFEVEYYPYMLVRGFATLLPVISDLAQSMRNRFNETIVKEAESVGLQQVTGKDDPREAATTFYGDANHPALKMLWEPYATHPWNLDHSTIKAVIDKISKKQKGDSSPRLEWAPLEYWSYYSGVLPHLFFQSENAELLKSMLLSPWATEMIANNSEKPDEPVRFWQVEAIDTQWPHIAAVRSDIANDLEAYVKVEVSSRIAIPEPADIDSSDAYAMLVTPLAIVTPLTRSENRKKVEPKIIPNTTPDVATTEHVQVGTTREITTQVDDVIVGAGGTPQAIDPASITEVEGAPNLDSSSEEDSKEAQDSDAKMGNKKKKESESDTEEPSND